MTRSPLPFDRPHATAPDALSDRSEGAAGPVARARRPPAARPPGLRVLVGVLGLAAVLGACVSGGPGEDSSAPRVVVVEAPPDVADPGAPPPTTQTEIEAARRLEEAREQVDPRDHWSEEELRRTLARETRLASAALETDPAGLEVEPDGVGSATGRVVYRVDCLPFRRGEAALDAETLGVLEQLAARFRLEPDSFVLEVHAHERGAESEGPPKALREARAGAVRRHLVGNLRLPADRVRLSDRSVGDPCPDRDTPGAVVLVVEDASLG